MTRQKWVCLVVTLALIAGAAGFLAHLRAHQRLGRPGVKTHALADSKRLQVDLPERVLDYQSKWVDVDDITLGTLPPDTSYGQRRYKAPDGFELSLNVVLMGTDRTSLHKPQFCLEGQGWHIDQGASTETQVHVERPCAYELPVVKLVATKEVTMDGQSVTARGIYVYWFVADGARSASVSGFNRMWMMARHLLYTGELQRWAYVSCLAVCAPGQEDATFERMKRFIAAAAPEFQLTPAAPAAVAAQSQ